MEILNLRILTNKISRKRYKYKSILHGVRNACSKAFVSLNFITHLNVSYPSLTYILLLFFDHPQSARTGLSRSPRRIKFVKGSTSVDRM